MFLLNHIDIFSFLKHSHSNEMKSKLLLDEDQQRIFDYIFKPILSYNFIGTRYNGQNLPAKIKEKLFGETQKVKQTTAIKNTFDQKLNIFNYIPELSKKQNNYENNINNDLYTDSNQNINDSNYLEYHNNKIKKKENYNENNNDSSN